MTFQCDVMVCEHNGKREPVMIETHTLCGRSSVVGSLLSFERFFPGHSYFPLSSKNHHFQIPILPGTVDHEPDAMRIC